MLSQKMQEALNGQINAELWSAYLYMSMSLDAEAEGYPGIAKWFWIQWLEEQDHARILQNYVIERGAKVSLKPLLNVRTNWRTPVEMYKDAFMHEMEITNMINRLYMEAQMERDFATQERLRWFLSEQVEEESSVRSIYELLCRAAGIDFSQSGRQEKAAGMENRQSGPQEKAAERIDIQSPMDKTSLFNYHLVDKELGMRCYRKAAPLE